MDFSRHISRRTALSLLVGGTIAFGASVSLLYTPRSLVEPSIPFRVALANPETRQQYIDEIVKIEFGDPPYTFANEFVYDHDTSRAKREAIAVINRQFDDPRTDHIIRKILSDHESLEQIVKDYLYDSRFFKYDGPQRKQAILDFLRSSQAFMDFKIKQKTKAIEDLGYMERHDLGATISYKYDFSSGKKSNIYVFPLAFGPISRNFEGLNFHGPSSGTKVRGILIHEAVHAKHHYGGINLGNGLEINKDNFLLIHPSLIQYIDEGTAQIVALDFLRQFIRGIPFFYRNYGTEYLDRIAEFYEVFSGYKKSMKEKCLNPFERGLADKFTQLVDPVLAEASDVIGYLKKTSKKWPL